MSPAMATGVTQTLWSMDDIVGLIEHAEAQQAPQKEGRIKNRRQKLQTEALPTGGMPSSQQI